jgi:hypothetical protein
MWYRTGHQERQMMAHAQEQGRAEQGSTGQHQWRMQSALCMQHSAVQDGNVAFRSAQVGDAGVAAQDHA